MIRFLLLTAFVGFLSACSDDYDKQVSQLVETVEGSQIGSSSDYWLVKGAFGMDNRVALVFGYVDDLGACGELMEMLNARYPSANYTCRKAN